MGVPRRTYGIGQKCISSFCRETWAKGYNLRMFSVVSRFQRQTTEKMIKYIQGVFPNNAYTTPILNILNSLLLLLSSSSSSSSSSLLQSFWKPCKNYFINFLNFIPNAAWLYYVFLYNNTPVRFDISNQCNREYFRLFLQSACWWLYISRNM
jgi:hypothetical protein